LRRIGKWVPEIAKVDSQKLAAEPRSQSGQCSMVRSQIVAVRTLLRAVLLAVLSKSPMPAVSKALALEYATNNIRFNTVSAGNINTPMHAKDNYEALAKCGR
jgi:NAD(P)-dependent dehydrogenase (short-subunit alcohol dehydrogenase family)